MDSRFERITKQHLETACEDIISGIHKEFANSNAWSVAYKGYDLPPKGVIQRACYHATGKILPVQDEDREDGFYGGKPSNDFLEKHGFQIAKRPSDRTLKAASSTD